MATKALRHRPHPLIRALLFVVFAVGTPSIAGATSSDQPLVPIRAQLVATESGHLVVVNERGKVTRRVPRFAFNVQGLEIAPDRRSAYVSVYASEKAPRLYKVALASGSRIRLATAISPSLSPDKRRLAYVAVELRRDIKYRTQLVIRNLRTRQVRKVALPAHAPLGTPPELVINWSPDSRHVAVFDGTVVRLVDAVTANTVDSQPAIAGGNGLAPVFLNRKTLVVLANCCIGRQHLVTVDLRSGARRPFVALGSPVEGVRRLSSGTLLVVTALHRLVRVAPGDARVFMNGVVAAAA